MTQKNTKKLEHELMDSPSIEGFLHSNKENLRSCTLAEYLQHLLLRKGLTKAEVIQLSGLEPHYAYHIFAGQKSPSRTKVLALALALGLSPTETQYLLYYARAERLYVRNSWDSILWYALEHHLSVLDTNLLLEKLSASPFLS